MINSCLVCGIGGQGTVLASKLIAYAAMKAGKEVRTSETIGMAQRGGCVVSHVRMADKESIYSPIIPKGKADILIGFEPAEAVRNLDYLRQDGAAVVNKKAIKPVTSSLSGLHYEAEDMFLYLRKRVKKLILIDGDSICDKCASPKVLNIALLAASAQTGMLGISVEELRKAVLDRIPEKYHAQNLMAIDLACQMEQ